MVVTFFQNQAACIAIKKMRLGNTFSSEWHARHPLAVCRHKQAQFRQYVLPTTRYPSCLFGSSSYNTCSTPYYFAQQSISLACHRLSVLSGWCLCIERQAHRQGKQVTCCCCCSAACGIKDLSGGSPTFPGDKATLLAPSVDSCASVLHWALLRRPIL
jgi:hypothetical protein